MGENRSTPWLAWMWCLGLSRMFGLIVPWAVCFLRVLVITRLMAANDLVRIKRI